MYYVYKMGVYGHGVFWIGSKLSKAIEEADKAAENDSDEYHNWVVFRYRPKSLSKKSNVVCDGHEHHEQLYSVCKDIPC